MNDFLKEITFEKVQEVLKIAGNMDEMDRIGLKELIHLFIRKLRF